MDKRAKDKLARSPGENGGGQNAQKDLHPRTGRDRTTGKTQDRMERGSRKRSSSAGHEKMKRVGDRQEKMEGYCSTGQSLQWAVVPMEEDLNSWVSYRYLATFIIATVKSCISTTLPHCTSTHDVHNNAIFPTTRINITPHMLKLQKETNKKPYTTNTRVFQYIQFYYKKKP